MLRLVALLFIVGCFVVLLVIDRLLARLWPRYNETLSLPRQRRKRDK
jgi:hypothetical protein